MGNAPRDEGASAPRSPPQQGDGVDELSRLLLEGWTMLADLCPRPNCHMPLARSREGRVMCCSCRLDVVSSTADRRGSQPAAPPSARPSAQAATENGAQTNGAIGDSGAGGRERDTGGAAGSQETGAGRESTPPPDVQTSSAVVPAGLSLARQERDAASLAMGEKLLQGWTMLQDGCPRCSTPLLRNSEGTLLCVSCSPGRANDAAAASRPGANGSAGAERDAGRAQTLQLGGSRGTEVVSRRTPQRAGALFGASENGPNPERSRGIGVVSRDVAAAASAAAIVESGRHTSSAVTVPHANSEGVVAAGNAAVGGGGLAGRASGGGLGASPRSSVPRLHAAPATDLAALPSGGGSTPAGGPGHEHMMDHVAELEATERAVVASLPALRARLAGARDTKELQAILEGIEAAGNAIKALRGALGAIA